MSSETKTHVVEVENDIKEIGRLSETLAALWVKYEMPPGAEMDATLALEEIVSNVIRHGYSPGEKGDIKVSFTFRPPAYEIEVADGGIPFNPLSREDPDLDSPIAQRQPGGLGIYLVKKLADDLRYDRREGRNHLIFRKKA